MFLMESSFFLWPPTFTFCMWLRITRMSRQHDLGNTTRQGSGLLYGIPGDLYTYCTDLKAGGMCLAIICSNIPERVLIGQVMP